MGETSQSVTGASAVSYVAGRGEFEEKTVALKIENVAEFLQMSDDELFENGLTFEAGNCTLIDGTQTRATWTYYFEHGKNNGQDWVGGYLCLEGPDDVKSAKASHSVSLSSGRKFITSCKISECKEFAQSGWGRWKLITKSKLLEKTRQTDSLDVTLTVKVFSTRGFKPVLQEFASPPSEVMQLRGQANSDLVKMLESEIGADVEIKVPNEVGGQVDESSHTRKVHKGILMARSSVFATMFDKESTMIEAQTGKVVIKDLSPKGLEVFLRYLYTGEVLEDWVHVIPEIINAAEKYDCGKLKQYCGHNLLPAVTTANAIKMFKLAKLHNLSFAVKGIMEFIHKNAKTVFTEKVIDQGFDNVESE